MNPRYPATALRIARIAATLSCGPLNKHELARATFTSSSTLDKYLRLLHSDAPPAERPIHIVRWERFGMYGIFIAVYALGRRKDARKPRALTSKQKNRNFLQRRQKDKERQEFYLARRRARDAAKRARVTPNTWLSALGA